MEIAFNHDALQKRLAHLKDMFSSETEEQGKIEHPPENESNQGGEDDRLPSLPHDSSFHLNKEEERIIQSYPGNLHYILKALVKTSKLTPSTSSYSQRELDNFKHNMRHLFVNAVNYDGGWHSADLRTLWADGWREQDIIRFMMAEKVKYIMCHNSKLISCLNLEAKGVFYFSK